MARWKCNSIELCACNRSIIYGKKFPLVKNITVTDYFSGLLNRGEIDRTTPALINEDGVKYTFESLDDISTRLAKVLRSRLGFWTTSNPDNDLVIAFCLNPHENIIILILAIIKLGCAYLALEPYYPEHELIPIISRIRPMLIITETSGPIRSRFDSLMAATEIDTIDRVLEAAQELFKDFSEADPLENLTRPCHRIAAIILTSGATELPIACRIGHGAILNTVLWQLKQLPYAEDEVLPMSSTISSAATVPEIFCPLFGGRPLTVIHNSMLTKPATLLPKMSQLAISRISLTPQILKKFLSYVEELGAEKHKLLYHLKYIYIGGDVLKEELGLQFFNLFKGHVCNLVVLYGATETMAHTVFEVYRNLNDFVEKLEFFPDYDLVPSGTPIHNMCVCILNNDNTKIVSQGVIGEIFIRGPSLSNGYVRTSSDKSKKQQLKIGHHLYYGTADLGRITTDKKGCKRLNFEGRRDDIVNIHGHTINMNNIKQAVDATQLVVDSKVCIDNPEKDWQTIFAAVILKENVTVQNLREKLRKTVEPYMQPEIYVMTEFPLLSSGRVNKQRLLRKYRLTKSESSPEDWQPLGLDAAQKQAALVLCDSVSTSTGISVRYILTNFDTNYFEVGGTSQNCVQACNLCRENGYYISIQDFVLAKSFSDITNRMVASQLKPRSSYSRTDDLKFDTIPLEDIHKDAVIELLASAYTSKGDMVMYIGATKQEFREFLSASWKSLAEDQLSMVVVEPDTLCVIGCCLSMDANRKWLLKKLTRTFQYRTELMKLCESRARKISIPPETKKVVQLLLLGTSNTLSPAENTILIESLMYETEVLAVRKGYSYILISSANSIIKHMCTQKKFDMLAELQLNTYKAKDKTKPFQFAEDWYFFRVFFKKVA